MRARTLLMFLVAAALLLSLPACSKGSSGEPAESTSPPSSSETPPVEQADGGGKPAAAEAVPMGQPAKSADWTITVKEVEREDSAGGAKASAGNELLVIKFDLTNGGTADQGTGPVYFRLADTSGAEFQAAQTGEPEFIFNIPQPIAAGETREILIAYDITKGAGPFTWTFEPFVEGGNSSPALLEVK